MPHWLQIAAAVAGAIASWRWLLQPVRRAAREGMRLLRRINDSGDGVRVLAEEQRDLAGAIVRLSVALVDDLAAQREELTDLRSQHEATTRMVVDLDADVRRIQRDHAKKGPTDDD